MKMTESRFDWVNDCMPDSDKTTQPAVELKPKGKLIKALAFQEDVVTPATKNILSHIEANHRIMICGDYDVDGITATVILYQALSLIGAEVSYMIPNRFQDGYGINERIVCEAAQNDVRLIITVDNGVSAHDAALLAAHKQIDLIITDHHTMCEQLPQTDYILHPKLDPLLEKMELCGATVAYLLAKALLSSKQFAILQPEFLQLLTLATLADMMPLDQPINREITYVGYQLMQKQPLPILAIFQKVLGCSSLHSDTLSYQITPMMNAVGRLADANDVVAAFLATNRDEQEEKVQYFKEMNQQRKAITETILQQACEIVDKEQLLVHEGFMVVYAPDWHQGVLGIVAQKMMQQFQRPIILLTQSHKDPKLYTGSARAFGSYHVKHCFDTLNQFILKQGGHQYAGGLSLMKAQLSAFTTQLRHYNTQILADIPPTKRKLPLTITQWGTFVQLDDRFLKQQEQRAPFGVGNGKEVIGISQVKVKQVMPLGKANDHVKLQVLEGDKTYQIVAFFRADLLEKLAPYTTCDVVIEVAYNHFNGNVTIQYQLVDLRHRYCQIFDYRNIRYQSKQPIENEMQLIIDEIPIDVVNFKEQLQRPQLTKIYLTPMMYEDVHVYETTLDIRYFEYLYKYLHQKQVIDLQAEALYHDLYTKKIAKSVFLYIIRVFFELNFVIIEGHICTVVSNVNKQKLEDSKSYQEQQTWLYMRRLLLAAPIETLYQELVEKVEEQ